MSALESLSIKSSELLDVIIAAQLTHLKVESSAWELGLLNEEGGDVFWDSVLQFVSGWSKNQNCTLSKHSFSVIKHSHLATSLLFGNSRNHVKNLPGIAGTITLPLSTFCWDLFMDHGREPRRNNTITIRSRPSRTNH